MSAEAPAAMPRWKHYIEAYREEYSGTVRLVLMGRLLVISLLSIMAALFDYGVSEQPLPVYLGLGLLFGLTYVYLLALKRSENLEKLILVQLVVDFCAQTLVIYLTGGVFNLSYASLYFVSVITAAFLISQQASLLYASLSSVSFTIISILYYFAAETQLELPLMNQTVRELVGLRWNEIIANLLSLSFALHLIAVLASQLPPSLSRVRIHYEEILDRMREGVVAIDNAGRIVYVNTEALRLLNWESVPQVIGRPFPEVLRRREDHEILEILTAGQDLHGEVDIDLRGRGVISVEVKTSVLRDERGRVRGVVGIFADLTLKRMMALVEKRLDRLRNMEAMSLGIAHEIRNPLASIRGAMQELARRSFTDEDDRVLAGIVLEESDRLDLILDDFLQFARMKPVELSEVELAPVIEKTLTLLRCREDATTIKLELRLIDAGPHRVPGDTGKLEQVLLNLGLNAIEAIRDADIEDGEVIFELEAGLLHRSPEQVRERFYGTTDGVEIRIRDNGPGVSEQQRTNLFTPFFSTKQSGTGLGLALVQKIVDAHGGDIVFAPNSPRGSIFRVLLPQFGRMTEIEGDRSQDSRGANGQDSDRR